MALQPLTKSSLIISAILIVGAVGAGGTYFVMSHGHGNDPSNHHSGAMGHGIRMHDEINMPGLRGENATAEESAEIAVLFRNFETITRDVQNLPNGIRTVTASTDPDVMDALVSHSIGMIDRVKRMDDPKIEIESPTLDIFFVCGEGIETTTEVTNEGLVVVQTSDDPELLAALQTHSAEVTEMAERGMAAVHEMMMADGRNH